MRKIIFSLFYLLAACTAGFAIPWGVLSAYQETQEAVRSGTEKYPFLIDALLQGDHVRVYLEGPQDMTPKERAQYEKEITLGYDQWFSYTAKTIRKKNRTEEFSDILPFLEKGIPVEFVNDKQDANINFKLVARKEIKTECESMTAAACYTRRYQAIPTIFLVEKTFSLRNILSSEERSRITTATHEIGHSLGLSDQYSINGGRNNSDMRYSTEQTRLSMMSLNSSLTCDDADGIVNLIDLSRKEFHGGLQGWQSFCKGGPRYVQGMVAGKGPYFIGFADDNHAKVDIVKPGQEEKTIVFNFDSKNEYYFPWDAHRWSNPEYDKQGRVVHAFGKNGEEIFYTYSYDFVWKLVVKEGRVLLEEQLLATRRNPKRQVSYAAGDEYRRIRVDTLNKKTKQVLLATGLGKSEGKKFATKIQISNDGEVQKEEWYGDYPGKEQGLEAFVPGKSAKQNEAQAAIAAMANVSAFGLGSNRAETDVTSRITVTQAQAERNRLKQQLIEFALQPIR